MEAKRKRTEPTTPPPAWAYAAAASISSVLGNDDLLREILLRLGFPTCLVRAAAVSKRWLRHASDPALLCRFRALHPPRPLGFYVVTYPYHPFLRFVPMPQSPQLAAVIRRGRFISGDEFGDVSDCRNGRLIVNLEGTFYVRSPLQPERGTTALPELPLPAVTWDIARRGVLLPEDGGDEMSYTGVCLMRDIGDPDVQAHVCDLQGGSWGEIRTSELVEVPQGWKICQELCLVADRKLYVICTAGYILGLDLSSMTLFYIKFPEGVENAYEGNLRLSRADGSGFYLIHAKSLQIHVWLHGMESSCTGNWKLVNTICLRQAFGHLADPTLQRGVSVRVDAVGDNADFVFLRIHAEVFYMCICSRKVEKVYDLSRDFGCRRLLHGIHPFMMVWPPTFPTLDNGHDQDE